MFYLLILQYNKKATVTYTVAVRKLYKNYTTLRILDLTFFANLLTRGSDTFISSAISTLDLCFALSSK